MKMIKQPTIPPMPKRPVFDARDTQYNLPIGTDCISRQAAIDIIEDFPHGDVWNVESMEEMIDRIKQLQPIQPVNCSEFPNSSDTDTISRQAAIDALRAMQTYKLFAGDDMLLIDQAGTQTELMLLPPIQPEIVRCKDCKHRDPEDKKCDCGHDIQWQLPRQDDWFCADGKRREANHE